MRVDEAATYLFYVRKPPLYGLVSYTLPNNHIFHTLLVSVSTFVFGNHPWAIRLPAFLAGVAMIPLAFIVARGLFGETAGTIAAAFVASSSVLIEYSTDARGYTMVAAIFLGLLALWPALLRSEPRAWWWFPVLSALGFFTIPTMLFPFGIVVAWLALSIARATSVDQAALRQRLARGVGVTALLTAIAYLPAILWTGPRAVFENRFVVSRPWGAWLTLIRPSIESTWLGWNRDLGIAGMALFLGFFAIGLVRDRTRLAFVAAAWCSLLVVLGRWIVFARVWTFLIPVYWLTVAAGVAWLARKPRWAPVVAFGACVAIGASVVASGSVLRSKDGYFPDAERVAVALSGFSADSDVVTFNPATEPLKYYALLHREKIRINHARPADRRLLIVVDSAVGQTLSEVASAEHVPPDAIAHAILYRRFSEASVYVCRLGTIG